MCGSVIVPNVSLYHCTGFFLLGGYKREKKKRKKSMIALGWQTWGLRPWGYWSCISTEKKYWKKKKKKKKPTEEKTTVMSSTPFSAGIQIAMHLLTSRFICRESKREIQRESEEGRGECER